MPRNIAGSPVRGEDCFGRDAFVFFNRYLADWWQRFYA
jgi:hypothetical protein